MLPKGRCSLRFLHLLFNHHAIELTKLSQVWGSLFATFYFWCRASSPLRPGLPGVNNLTRTFHISTVRLFVILCVLETSFGPRFLFSLGTAAACVTHFRGVYELGVVLIWWVWVHVDSVGTWRVCEDWLVGLFHMGSFKLWIDIIRTNVGAI